MITTAQIQEFDEAIRLNPNDANAYNNRGVAYERKDDYGHAIQNYDQAILLNSNYTSAYSSRGSAYFAQSNLTAAIADFVHTISAAPSSSAAGLRGSDAARDHEAAGPRRCAAARASRSGG
jgi:tetratricopeptide (TPR) repeat protein